MNGNTHGTLHKARIQVMPAFKMVLWIAAASALWEQPLLAPFPWCMWIFPVQRLW